MMIMMITETGTSWKKSIFTVKVFCSVTKTKFSPMNSYDTHRTHYNHHHHHDYRLKTSSLYDGKNENECRSRKKNIETLWIYKQVWLTNLIWVWYLVGWLAGWLMVVNEITYYSQGKKKIFICLKPIPMTTMIVDNNNNNNING